MSTEIELKTEEVGRIIEIAMQGNEKCNSCEFEPQCFFAYVCLSNNYKFWLDKACSRRKRMLEELSKAVKEQENG